MITIRLATENDSAEILKIKPIPEWLVKERLEIQSRGEGEFLVIEADGKLVTFTLLAWNGSKTHPEYPQIVDLNTKGSVRGKGYGTMMIGECEKRAKAKGFSKIGMCVNANENCPAQRLYKKLGYVHDSRPEYVDGVYDGVEEIVIDMEKKI